jgi:hypothetical protein
MEGIGSASIAAKIHVRRLLGCDVPSDNNCLTSVMAHLEGGATVIIGAQWGDEGKGEPEIQFFE